MPAVPASGRSRAAAVPACCLRQGRGGAFLCVSVEYLITGQAVFSPFASTLVRENIKQFLGRDGSCVCLHVVRHLRVFPASVIMLLMCVFLAGNTHIFSLYIFYYA